MSGGAEVEITFLGTGTSHGVPVIGCHCPVCHSPDPRDKRLRTAIHVRTPELSIIVDTPPDFRTQCLREGIERVDAVIYTHSHADHVLGFDDLRRYCEMQGGRMPIYASADVLGDLRRVYAFAFDGSSDFPGYIRPEPYEITGPFALQGTTITPVRLPHGRYMVNGYVFSRGDRRLFAYMTDCNEITPQAFAAAAGVEIFVVDALRHTPHSTHLTVEQALDAARRMGAPRTFFTHMCHDLSHAGTEARLPPNVRLAYDGLRIFAG